MLKKTTLTLLFTLTTGCATIERGSHQSIKIFTQNDTQSELTRCKAINEEGQWENITPRAPITIHRDGNPLEIECQNPNQIGTGTVNPKFSTRLFIIDFLALDACLISCLIDAGTNAFYGYPETATVIMPDKSK